MEGIKRVAMMSPENGKKMLKLQERLEGELKEYLIHHADKQEADLICRANTTLYNLAQSRGISLWKLCFEVMPHYEVSESKVAGNQQGDDIIFTQDIDYDLHLVPIVIDWEHGPSYWEKKYRDLKERVKELLKEEKD